MEQTYHGSCHCGTVRYQATLDLAAGTGKCNCTCCSKIRNWSATAKDFELFQGSQVLGGYAKDWGEGNIHHRFCTRCGVTLYGHGCIPQAGGAFVSVQVDTLDDAGIDALVSGPVHYADGLHDNWMAQAPDTRAM